MSEPELTLTLSPEDVLYIVDALHGAAEDCDSDAEMWRGRRREVVSRATADRFRAVVEKVTAQTGEKGL